MADSIATLGLKIESSEAATAATNLENVAAAAKGAEAAAGGTTSAFAKTGAEFEEFVRHAQRHILSLVGANESTRAFTGIITRLPIPLVAAGAAVVALTAAYSQGKAEADDYAKAIALSGNFAGVTTGQLAAYADAVAKTTGNVHVAADALATLVATGAVGRENLSSFATVAVQASQLLGVSVKEVAKDLNDLADAPLESVTKLGRAFGFLTPQLYEQVRALQASGNAAAAADVAQTALSASLAKQTKEVEEYESVWQTIGKLAGEAWDNIRGLGRGNPEKALEELKAIREAGLNKPGQFFEGFSPDQKILEAQIAALQKIVDARAADAAAQQKGNTFAREYLELQKAIGVEADANATRSAAQFAASSGGFSDAVKAAQAEIKSRQDALDAQHDAAIISDTAYYDAKRKLIQQDAAAEVSGLQAQNDLLEQQIAQEARNLALLKSLSSDPGELATKQANADASAIAKRAQIASNLNQIAIAQVDAAGKIDQANAAQELSNKRLESSYLTLVAAGAKYNAELEKQFNLQLQGIGAGNLARDRASQLADIEQRFADQARQVAEQRDSKQIDEAEFTRRNEAIKNGLAQARGLFESYYDDINQKQSDWLNGAKEAFHNYIEAGKNVADLSDKFFTSAIGHMEDSLASFAATGKFSFKDLTNSILADLVRMEIKILESKALASIFGAVIGAGAGEATGGSGVGELTGSTAGFAATGGNINGPTIVGEAGPELFVPNQSGTVVPNGAWQGMGGGRANIGSLVVNNGSGVSPGAAEAAVRRAVEQAKAEIYDAIGRGQWNGALRQARAG